MNLLLDTHVFIWATANPDRLSEKVINLLHDTNNQWLLSMVSVWEMQIKTQLGKLDLKLPLPELIETQKRVNNLEVLPIKLEHIFSLRDLPNYHRDPFDRLIIAQGMLEQLAIVSIDSIFDRYTVNRIW